ncbi:MAG: CCA tRNA nucleotidyltransferase [Mariprofundus sp.]
MCGLNPDSLPSPLLALCRAVSEAGGQAWLVGGCVRDLLLGILPKDYDLEVYWLELDTLQQIAGYHGRVEHVGRHFGVLKCWTGGLEIDLALPRTERKSGRGHCGFDITSNPHISPETASLRRDFTINAMMYNPLDGSFLDFHDGKNDLENKQLKHVSSAFSQDPLRPLRAMQFAARFDLTLDVNTARLCQSLLAESDSLPPERVWGEWKKWSHAAYPSAGLRALKASGWLSLYPELATLSDCPQDAHWHPEGDVWTHTLQVCDQAARIAARNKLDHTTSEHLLFAALCHDLGKPATTITTESNQIRSPGHSEAGIQPTKTLLKKVGAPAQLFEHIRPLILEHITHLHGEPTHRAVRRLAHRLEPANIELWEMLVEADASGRSPAPVSRPALAWLQQAETLHSHLNRPGPVLTGRMLIEMGVSPGPAMGELLGKAYEAQLDGEIEDEDSARLWYRKHAADDNTQG